MANPINHDNTSTHFKWLKRVYFTTTEYYNYVKRNLKVHL